MSRSTSVRIAALCALAMMVSAGLADAGGGKRRRSNMPEGWHWPPSVAMKRAGKACKARLDALGVRWRQGARAEKIATPVVIPAMTLGGIRLVSTYRKPPFVMDCHLAVAVAEQAQTLYELGVRELRFSSIHRYTRVRVNGQQRNSLSRHALGLAIDVWHMVDDAGVVHSVEDDYPGGDALLLAVEKAMNESGAFRMLLTPANDPASHSDHFHFEAHVDYTAAEVQAQRGKAAHRRKPGVRSKQKRRPGTRKRSKKARRRP